MFETRRRRGALRRRTMARERHLPARIGLVASRCCCAGGGRRAYWLWAPSATSGPKRLARLPADADATQGQHIAYFAPWAGEFSRHAKDDDQLPALTPAPARASRLRAALGYASTGSAATGRGQAPPTCAPTGDLGHAAGGGRKHCGPRSATVPRASQGALRRHNFRAKTLRFQRGEIAKQDEIAGTVRTYELDSRKLARGHGQPCCRTDFGAADDRPGP